MENRVDEFCLWIIQAFVIPLCVESVGAWSTGYFDELAEYDDECRKQFGRPSQTEERELMKQLSEEIEAEKKNQTFFWKLFNGKNIMYVVFATQIIHLIYSVYVGKQFPVQPLSDFENSNIIWETICLCARDATIQMNHHILVLRLGCRVLYDVSNSLFSFYLNTSNSTSTDDKKNDDNNNPNTTIDNTEDSLENISEYNLNVSDIDLSSHYIWIKNEKNDRNTDNETWIEILNID